jgi:hypothetical protein
MFLLLSAATCSSLYACHFWGMIGNHPVARFASYGTEASWLCGAAAKYSSYNSPYPYYCPHGWAGIWCAPGTNGVTFDIQRGIDSVYENPDQNTCDPDYANFCGAAATDSAWSVLAHARRKPTRTPELPRIPGPHPFVYELYNNTYSYVHNGGITEASFGTVEDAFGAGFAAMDQFVDRQWTSWYHPTGTDTVVDSEYIDMLLMRNFMVAESYYWAHDSLQSNMEFAVNKSYNYLGGFLDPALNSAVMSLDTAWLMQKYTSTNTTHRVSYRALTGTNNWFRELSTASRTGGSWTSLSASTYNNKMWRLVPGYDDVRCDGLPAIAQSLTNPLELRINERSQSTSAQNYPDISTDPKRSTFVVVWQTADGNRIKARWLDQMGLAEQKEFFVDLGATGVERRTPAVAHSPNGDTLMVVWSEKPSGGSVFTLIKARRFIWDQAAHVWNGDPAEIIANTSLTGEVRHPKVALGPAASYVIVWQHYPVAGQSNIRWSGHTATTDITNAIMSGAGFARDPDVTFVPIAATPFVATWAEANGAGNLMARGIYDNQLLLGNIVTLKSFTADPSYLKPSISAPQASSGGISPICGIAYWGYSNPSVNPMKAVKLFVGTAGALTITQDVVGTDTILPVPPDLAFQGTNMVITYSRTVTNYLHEIKAAIQNGTAFGAPIQINVPNPTNQMYPAIAISQVYNCSSARPAEIGTNYYQTLCASNPRPFDTRRIVVWASDQQDGDSWAVVGRFAGVSGTTAYDWFASDPVTGIGGSPMLNMSGDDEPVKDPKSLDDLNSSGSSTLPLRYELYPIYPNPFNPDTRIRFDIPETVNVSLQVFSIDGRLVETLISGSHPAGSHVLSFDGSNLATGTYILRMQAGSFSANQKMLLVK